MRLVQLLVQLLAIDPGNQFIKGCTLDNYTYHRSSYTS